jgi:hypothetical protein
MSKISHLGLENRKKGDFYGIIYDTNTYFAVRIRIKGILVFTCAVAFFVDFNISFAF